jgi:hypothetical protein
MIPTQFLPADELSLQTGFQKMVSASLHQALDSAEEPEIILTTHLFLKLSDLVV